MDKEKKLGQEPAFAKSAYVTQYNVDPPQEGMSKRFYATCAAMQGILSNSYWIKSEQSINYKHTVKIAYKMADELLEQEFNN